MMKDVLSKLAEWIRRLLGLEPIPEPPMPKPRRKPRAKAKGRRRL